MAYDQTEVAVVKSQDQIRKLIYSHKGTGLMLVSQPPREGFEAMVTIDATPFHIRIMATCRIKDKFGYTFSDKRREQEERRVWRVLFHHLKAMFEAADSGVVAIQDVILPYVVTRDGRTIAEHIVPRMREIMTSDPTRLLTVGEA